MTRKSFAAYSAPEIEVLLYGVNHVLCASIEDVSEEDFDFEWN